MAVELRIGTITKILDKDLYTIEVDIPGFQKGVKAFPRRGEVDEPRINDVVVLTELDPDYRSYYLYEKLKENKFIGIRSRGKILQMNEEEVILGIFDNGSWVDRTEDIKPTSYIKVDKSGNVEIVGEGNINVKISGTTNIEAGGNVTVNAKSQVTITGGGTVKMAGSAVPSTTPGPFNCIPSCPFSGAPHSSTQISGV